MSTNLGTNPIRTHQYFFPMLFISLLGTLFHFFFYPFKPLHLTTTFACCFYSSISFSSCMVVFGGAPCNYTYILPHKWQNVSEIGASFFVSEVCTKNPCFRLFHALGSFFCIFNTLIKNANSRHSKIS